MYFKTNWNKHLATKIAKTGDFSILKIKKRLSFLISAVSVSEEMPLGCQHYFLKFLFLLWKKTLFISEPQDLRSLVERSALFPMVSFSLVEKDAVHKRTIRLTQSRRAECVMPRGCIFHYSLDINKRSKGTCYAH